MDQDSGSREARDSGNKGEGENECPEGTKTSWGRRTETQGAILGPVAGSENKAESPRWGNFPSGGGHRKHTNRERQGW